MLDIQQPELAALQSELASFEGLLCSTFFSRGERACLQQLLQGKAQIIWILPMALPKHIPVAWTDALLEGRALWLSAFARPEATRANCEQANKWVKAFCNRGS